MKILNKIVEQYDDTNQPVNATSLNTYKGWQIGIDESDAVKCGDYYAVRGHEKIYAPTEDELYEYIDSITSSQQLNFQEILSAQSEDERYMNLADYESSVEVEIEDGRLHLDSYVNFIGDKWNDIVFGMSGPRYFDLEHYEIEIADNPELLDMIYENILEPNGADDDGTYLISLDAELPYTVSGILYDTEYDEYLYDEAEVIWQFNKANVRNISIQKLV